MALKGDVVKEYLKRFPTAHSKTLANLIYKENRSLFKDAEQARRVVRHYRGSAGSLNRKTIRDKTFFKPGKKPANLFGLPDARQVPEVEDFIFPYKTTNNVLVICDLHPPFHDVAALEAAINFGLQRNVNGVVILGDGIDAHALSKFIVDPRKRDFPAEVEINKDVYSIIRREFKKALMIYKKGNHCYWYDKYLMVKAPELLGLPNYSFETTFGLSDNDITVVGDKQVIIAGKLAMLHGHEYKGVKVAANAARGLFLKALENTICGHWHITSEHTVQTFRGNITAAWTIGCLSSLRPEYLPINQWNHGCAIVEFEDIGTFRVDNRKIYKGKIL